MKLFYATTYISKQKPAGGVGLRALQKGAKRTSSRMREGEIFYSTICQSSARMSVCDANHGTSLSSAVFM